jgi:hypothetical protein
VNEHQRQPRAADLGQAQRELVSLQAANQRQQVLRASVKPGIADCALQRALLYTPVCVVADTWKASNMPTRRRTAK